MRILALLSPTLLLAGCLDQAGAEAVGRDRISVVGSSTVYPFTALVAERFLAAAPDARAPVVESTGTGAGFRLFCAGLGPRHPDLADASRRMRLSEWRDCQAHGVGPVMEVELGLDGVALAQPRAARPMGLTPLQIYRALAASPGGRPNAARTWADVDPALPATPIQVYGPPATSGTRDSFAQLILARGCEAAEPRARALATRAPAAYARLCLRIREDGAYADAGEDDNLVIQKLRASPDALGVFGYGYLERNGDSLRGVPIDGVAPDARTIADGRYPGSRPLFLYVKARHLRAVPGLARFVRTYADSWGPGGPLVRRGLIAAPAAARARSARAVAAGAPLDPRDLA